MFDKYIVPPSGPSHVSVEVTEKRAPTDDSIRIYREMLEKARSEVIESHYVDNSLVDFEAVRFMRPDVRDIETILVFSLNGEKFDVRFAVNEELGKWDRAGMIRTVLKRAADGIVEKFLERIAKGYAT